MIELMISLAIVLPLNTLFSLFIIKKFVPLWDANDRVVQWGTDDEEEIAFLKQEKTYGFKGSQWKKMLLFSNIISVIFTLTVAAIGFPLYMSIAQGLLVFFLVATATTDWKTHLIPRELSNMALIIGLVVGLVGYATAQYYDSSYLMSHQDQFMFQIKNFAAFMAVIAGLFVLIMFVKSFGFGDIKMFWATGLFMAAFIMVPQMLMIFMGMFIVLAVMMGIGMVKAKSWKATGGLPALPAFAVAYILVIIVTNLLSVIGVTY